MKHFVITRLAIKWNHPLVKMSWQDWLNDSINLMDTYCRPSLRKQTDQDFTLLSLVDPSVTYVGNKLPNEIIVPCGSMDRMDLINAVNGFISGDWIILTRLDRDDCLRFDFLEKIKQYLREDKEQYIDIKKMYSWDTHTDKVYDSPKYKTCISPFVSVKERVNDGHIRCVPFAVNHAAICNVLPGKKVTDLLSIQVVHGTNVINRTMGPECEINKSEYL